MTAVLSASRVSKKFARRLRHALWYGLRDIAREMLLRSDATALRADEFWAVDDVSFELGRGEALAVIGGNGAGKSTLLKVLYGLIKPDRGEIHVRGRIGAMIELGAGLQPQLTARENIRLIGALSGFGAREVEALHERVIDFAELRDVLDMPLQSYSTGMRARLAYALAAQVEPAVLLVDEVLAVGDLSFQHKCAKHLRGYLDRGGALLLVSHNTHQIQSLCQRGILLDRGRQIFAGSAADALTHMFELRTAGAPEPAAITEQGVIAVRGLRAEAVDGESMRTGHPMRITIEYEAREDHDVMWGFSIHTWDQWVCVTGEHDARRQQLRAGTGTLTCTIPRLPLIGGRYALHATILDFETRQPLAMVAGDAPAVIDVRSATGAMGNSQMALSQLVRFDVDWN